MAFILILFLLLTANSALVAPPSPSPSPPPFWSNYQSEMDIPGFREFSDNHKFFAAPSTHVRDFLVGGVGPICSTGTEGQMVRALGFWSGLTAKPRWTGREEGLGWIGDLDVPLMREELRSVLRDRSSPNANDPFTSLGLYQGEDTGWSQSTLIDFYEECESTVFPKTMDHLRKLLPEIRYGPRHTAIGSL